MLPTDLDGWITGTLVPRWIERAVVRGRPGYLEYLTPDGEPDWRERKTTLVTARLIYTFAHAHLLRPSEASLAAARHGMDFLLSRCRDADGRFRHAVREDGSAIDGRADLYDLAFVLFAVAWYVRASGERETLKVADEVLAFMDARLAQPNGGFAEDDAGTLPQRQNPHMHLLEAFHALAETTGEARFLARAGDMVSLIQDRLLDRETGSLGEFFTADWTAWPSERGELREPGHHFEWVWLLMHHARLTGDRQVLETAERLYGFGLRHGLAPLSDGLPVALDGVDRQGRPVARTALLWPQTEAIKAFAARLEFGDAAARPHLDAHMATLFRHYVDPQTGIWHNQLGPDGKPVMAELPVRVLYHLMLAVAEVARVEKVLAARG